MAAAQAGSSLVQSPDGASAPFSPGSYLCFESSKSGSSKRNKVIKLVDITDIQKVGVPSTPALPHQPPSLQEEGSRRAPELMGGVGRHTGVWRGGRVLLGDQALLLPAEVLPPRRLYRGRPCTGHAPSGASPPPRGPAPGVLTQSGRECAARGRAVRDRLAWRLQAWFLHHRPPWSSCLRTGLDPVALAICGLLGGGRLGGEGG